ncbi:hypothetical protein MRS44_016743 [Fusarium solani]|uniref:uncharacterized protein n=1 Tax=Fusarium solani TaxID=169388 RepID=UPI0032C45EED|nr:hypothetical protein MRS44_016743 [Fusarium solani]
MGNQASPQLLDKLPECVAGGRYLWALEADGITRFFWLFWMAGWVYTISMAAIKISILLGFYRIFPSKAFRRLVILSIVFTAIWGAVFSIIYMVQCRPLGFFWHAWKGTDEGSCLSTSALIWSASLIAIITDFFMMVMPVFQLWPLQMEYKKKVLVAFMLCIDDLTSLSLWSVIEGDMGVVCACLPQARQLHGRWFPKMLGSTANEHQVSSGSPRHVSRSVRGRVLAKRHLASTLCGSSGHHNPRSLDAAGGSDSVVELVQLESLRMGIP